MKTHLLSILCFTLLFAACKPAGKPVENLKAESFVQVDGPDLIQPNGEKLLIRGTNLGNWLNPEGYMFGFSKTNSARQINEMFSELVGPDRATEFWKQFKDNYITFDDIQFIASTGANTIRLPFHYKLFTDEDYLGITGQQDGFQRIDTLIGWCKKNNLYLILDMHDAPGGQTGDNIDDSFGYPWLFESEIAQTQFCEIWTKIADYYKNEPTILGYELCNEPIAPYFSNMDELNAQLEPLYKKAVAAIRTVDTHHIVLLGGAQWNGNFKPFTDSKLDDKIMYTCHRYGGEPTKEAIGAFINFRDSVNLPMYMGEIGHNSDEWMAAFCKTMVESNIGWTFWPYKKINNSSFAGITPPGGWDKVVAFSEAPRATFKEIREARPDQQEAWKAMQGFIENSKFKNNVIQKGYITALGLKIPQ
jgi:aryl-phospho-beta-D-glucosidase BglC (GH1 family)